MNWNQERIDFVLKNYSPEETKTIVQNEAYHAWEQSFYRGTFEGCTGVGKTRVGVMAAVNELTKNPDALVYILVPTETLRDTEWPNEFRKWNAGQYLSKVNIICHASMDSEIALREIDLTIFDECHHVTPQNSSFFSRNKSYKILGLSASLPKTTDGEDDFVKAAIINTFCPSVYKVTLEEGIALKLVSDFKITVLLFDLDTLHLNVENGTEKRPSKTTERAHYLFLTKKIQQCMYKNPGAKFFWIQKRAQLIRNAKSKLALAREIFETLVKDDTRTLIFCGSIEQSEQLCGENVYNSSTSDRMLRAFQEGLINYLGAVDALNEGKNIDKIDNVINVQMDSKERNAIQRTGRMIRWRVGHEGNMVMLVAKNTCDEKWYKAAFKNFDKKRIKEVYVKVNYEKYATA